MWSCVTLLPAHFVSAAKGAGKLAARPGGGDAAGPEAGAAEVTVSGGELHCGLGRRGSGSWNYSALEHEKVQNQQENTIKQLEQVGKSRPGQCPAPC